MESLIGTAIAVGIGLCIVGLGIWQMVTGNPRLLHSYHYATTPAAELAPLARETGAGLIAAGVGCMLMVPSVLPAWASVVGVVTMIAGIVVMLASIIRHNGGLITGGDTGMLSGMTPKTRLLVCGVFGALGSLFGIAPGAYMMATGDVSLLHSYHYATVAAADLPRLAFCEGLCMMGLGVSIFLCVFAAAGLTQCAPRPRWAIAIEVAGIVLFAASLAALLLFIPYFGGSLNP